MAIAVDATSSGTASAGTTVTVAHTCTGSDLVLVVGVGMAGGTISGVTYDGNAMSEVAAKNDNMNIKLFVLADPPTGAHNIVVTKTSGAETDVGGISFTGALTSAATNTNSDFGTSHTLSVATSGTGNGFVVSMCTCNDPNSLSETGAGTQWASVGTGSSFLTSYVYQAYASGGDVSESWTSGNSRGADEAGVQITEAPTTAIKTFDGLAYASVKTVDGLAIASVKTANGLA